MNSQSNFRNIHNFSKINYCIFEEDIHKYSTNCNKVARVIWTYFKEISIFNIVVFVQPLSHIGLFATCGLQQARLPVLHHLLELFKLMSIESVMLSNHHVLCCPLFLLPSKFPSIRIFSSESALCIRWPKCYMLF